MKEPSYLYYKTAPDLLVKSHFPQMVEDTFLEKNMSREEFSNLPLIIHPELKIANVIEPIDGIISSFIDGGEVSFRITGVVPKSIFYSFGKDKNQVEFSTDNDEILFKVPLELGSKWLLIYYDDQPALGYKID
ncbi:MAG: hypothetical protein HKN48_05800 [Flavobacteriaceae bacterium]|nr:hypothetical protein [Flavobacteriaceae bacterium]